MVSGNIHKNNIMARDTLNHPDKLPDLRSVVDLDLMPNGYIYEKEIASLSDEDLLIAINNKKFSLFYVYEYAERLHKRGMEIEALRVSYLGTLPILPKKYSISRGSVRYRGEVSNVGSGFMPSDCLASEICGDLVAEKPLYSESCRVVRSR
jgi:hypothetical protein